MGPARERARRTLALLAMPLLAAGWLWRYPPVAPVAAARWRTAEGHAAAPPAPRATNVGGEGCPELLASPAEERGEEGIELRAPASARAPATARTPSTGPAPAASRPALVQVRGEVRRDGRAVPDFDLAFELAGGAGQAESDWDFTDRRGGFEVELPPGTYEVLGGSSGGPHWELWTRVVVPAQPGELVLDFDLPR